MSERRSERDLVWPLRVRVGLIAAGAAIFASLITLYCVETQDGSEFIPNQEPVPTLDYGVTESPESSNTPASEQGGSVQPSIYLTNTDK